jgi:phosphate:Na+ symporter
MLLSINLGSRIIKFISIIILCLALFIPLTTLNKNLYFEDMSVVVREQKAPYQNIQDDENTQAVTQEAHLTNNMGKSQAKLEIFPIVMGVMAGLVLFLYGVTKMAEGMDAIAGDRIKNILNKFTTNHYTGVATGIVATTLLDSSSVTIIIVIAMVSAGLLDFVQSLGVVLGANIGTTLGVQIIAFNINQYAPIALFIGFLLLLLSKQERIKQIGIIVFGIGLLFFGLGQIENVTEAFQTYPPFIDWMESLGQNKLQGALVGAIFTVIIQSSSATAAIVVTLASQGLVSLPTGVALVLGAEIGTCADTLVATIGRERPAVRTGVFHLLFNLVSVGVGLLFAEQLIILAQWISWLMGSGDDIARQIANAQLIFNVLGVGGVITFLPSIARGLERLIPERQNQNL